MNEEQQVQREEHDDVATDNGEVTDAVAPVTHQDLSEWRGRTLSDANGERIGKLEDVYFDIDTDEASSAPSRKGCSAAT